MTGMADRHALVQSVRRDLATYIVGANVLGVVIAVVLAAVVIPGPNVLTAPEFRIVNTVVVPIYAVVTGAVVSVVGGRRADRAVRWAFEGRAPTFGEFRATLSMPWQLARVQSVLWGTTLILVTTADGVIDRAAAATVGISIALGGAVACAFAYLLAEFALRPIAARALVAGYRHRVTLGGVQGRLFLTWNLGSSVPVLGIVSVALASMFVVPATHAEFERAILVLGSIALFIGGGLLYLAGRAATDPIRAVRAGMRTIERGDTGVRVEVFDGTELGDLQSGFNSMAAGLEERERIRDIFGLQVGREVAELALSTEPSLGGEERDVAVLFVDLIGSTELAVASSPTDVVAVLNRFFQVVVDEVDAHGGIVDKFEGDAALAVFGAPESRVDPYGDALRTAVRMGARLAAEVADVDAAIGVASGRVVAGNVGARTRFEYTVIGDPVNEAARLSEYAKTVPGRVVASGSTLDLAGDGHRQTWTIGDAVVLRGRSVPTAIAVPSGTGEPGDTRP